MKLNGSNPNLPIRPAYAGGALELKNSGSDKSRTVSAPPLPMTRPLAALGVAIASSCHPTLWTVSRSTIPGETSSRSTGRVVSALYAAGPLLLPARANEFERFPANRWALPEAPGAAKWLKLPGD